jgi:hypothetical protein
MLIKRLQRILRNYRDKKKVEILFKFLIFGRYFFAVRPKNGYIISSNSYIVSEYPDNYKLKPYQRKEILDVIRRDNKFRGRRYIILC